MLDGILQRNSTYLPYFRKYKMEIDTSSPSLSSLDYHETLGHYKTKTTQAIKQKAKNVIIGQERREVPKLNEEQLCGLETGRVL